MPSTQQQNNSNKNEYFAVAINGICGYNLRKSVFHNPDPYVKVRILPGNKCKKYAHHKQRYRTKRVQGTINPQWKEQFYIWALKSDIIEWEVKDHFERGKPLLSGVLGKLEVPVTDILQRLNCSERRITAALTKRSLLGTASGSLSFVVSDGRSNHSGELPHNNLNNGHNEHVDRNNVSSSDFSPSLVPTSHSNRSSQSENIPIPTDGSMHSIGVSLSSSVNIPPIETHSNNSSVSVQSEDRNSSDETTAQELKELEQYGDDRNSSICLDKPESIIFTLENILDKTNNFSNEDDRNESNSSSLAMPFIKQDACTCEVSLSEQTGNGGLSLGETGNNLVVASLNADAVQYIVDGNTDNQIHTELSSSEIIPQGENLQVEAMPSTSADNSLSVAVSNLAALNEISPKATLHSTSLPFQDVISSQANSTSQETNEMEFAVKLDCLKEDSVRNDAKTRSKKDKETLLNLLKFVALSQTAKLSAERGGLGVQSDLMEVELHIHRPSTSSHFGFNIVGGSESKHLILRKMGVYVTRVYPNSPAKEAEVKIYDRILAVNDKSMMKVSHAAVVDALYSSGCDVDLKVERRTVPSSTSSQRSSPITYNSTSSALLRRSSLPISLNSRKLSTPKSPARSSLSQGLTTRMSFPSRSTAALIEDEMMRSKHQKVNPLAYLEATPAGVAAISQRGRLAESAKRRHRLASRTNEASNILEELSQDGLPENWEACRDRYGRVFYLDHVNHVTMWQKPTKPPTAALESEDELLKAVSSNRRIQRNRRYHSLKGDRNYERVMRRYQSIKRVMRRNIVPENLQTSSDDQGDFGETILEDNDTSHEPAPSSIDSPVDSTGMDVEASSEPILPDDVVNLPSTSVEDEQRSNRPFVAVETSIIQETPLSTEGTVSQSTSSSRSQIARQISIPTHPEQTPSFRFISNPEFIALMSSHEEAYGLYMGSSSVKYMVTKINRDKNHFWEYQHNKELVKFINCFADSSKPLPRGWDSNVDDAGITYFINHNQRFTTFIDPRLPFQAPEENNITTVDSNTQTPTCSHANGSDERLPVQSPLATTAPVVAPRPNGSFISQSRVIEGQSFSGESQTSLPTIVVEEESTPASYNEKLVAFLRQPNIIEIIKEKYPALPNSPSLKDKIISIRSQGIEALERYGNSVQLTMMLSMFDNEIMSFVIPEESRRSALTERPSIAESVVSRQGSPSTSPANSRSRGPTPLLRNFNGKLRSLYRKLEQKGYGQGPGKNKLVVHRENLLEEAFRKVMNLERKELQRNKLFVSFVGEEGLDYSGPSREFFFLISRELFNPYYGLFEYSAVDTYTLQISPMSTFVDGSLQWFRFAGRIIGLCLIHHCLLDAFFTRPLYKALLRSRCDLSDLRYVDEQFYQSMVWMKENDITDVLDLTFSVDEELFGKIEEKELKSNGKNIVVTEKNKKDYIERMVKWRVARGTLEQTNMLIRGFNEVIDLRLVSPFDARELELVICGTADIDLKDWRLNTEYRGGYHDLHPVIQWFWLALKKFDNERRLRLLQFVTGTSSIPYEGFAALRGPNGPKRFCIERWGKSDCLPRSHTCFNRIDLPPYRSFTRLWEKLVIAVEETSTFAME